MTDRELLELAAKAAGYARWDWADENTLNVHDADDTHYLFSPLTDDGDALRLAVKLELDVTRSGAWVYVSRDDDFEEVAEHTGDDDDPYAATRRAIVRAAAEIGKELK